MRKKRLRVFSALLMSFVLFACSMTTMASDVSQSKVDLTLLEVEAHPNADNNVETPKERHKRLVAEGYVLENIEVTGNRRSLTIVGPDGQYYETRVVTSTYTQPNQTTVKYGEAFLNLITQSTISNVIEVGVGFVDRVGWIPSALGINTNSLADFFSRGRVTHICDSTLFYYDIEVRPVGTNTYYFVASSEKYAMVVTAVSSGFSESGMPVHKTVSGTETSRSANYEDEWRLSNIAVNYYVTGGLNGTYAYHEDYPEITYIRLF